MHSMDFHLIELYQQLVELRTQLNIGENMSYLVQETSYTDYGLVKVGNNIKVVEGEISLDQNLSPDSDVEFHNVNVTNDLTVNHVPVILTVTPTAGPGISISDLVSGGYDASFTVNNTGVLKLTAGTGISLSGSTGEITISSTGSDIIKVYGVTSSYTATANDEYIGVNSTSAVTITLPTGITGKLYTIKDEHGDGSGKITITPASGEKIDNNNNFVLTFKNQSVTLVFRAGQWRVI